MNNNNGNELYSLQLRRVIYVIGIVISIIAAIFNPFYFWVTLCLFVALGINCLSEKDVRKRYAIYQKAKFEEERRQREMLLNERRAEFSRELSSIPKVAIRRSDETIKRRPFSEMPEIHFINITRSTVVDKIFPLVCIDIETTGLHLQRSEIIEVSAIKYDVGFKPVSCFTTLVKPKKPIPPEATQINNITNDMVADSPTFSEIATAFSKYISGCNIVGHNAMFDLKFLFVSGVKLPPKARYYDTLTLSRVAFKGMVDNFKLDTLCKNFSIHRDVAHRSSSDCLATAKLFDYIIRFKTV